MVGFYRENQNTLGKWPTAGTADSATASELGERIERYFRVHPEASREAFLLEAVRHELSLREQPQSTGPSAVHTETDAGRDNLDQSAALAARLADLHYQQYGIWPRVRRFFMHEHAEE